MDIIETDVPRIVESGPISVKLDMGAAIRLLLADAVFAEKLRELVKEYLTSKMTEQQKENNDG